jgi:anti-sigma B factor antagonist
MNYTTELKDNILIVRLDGDLIGGFSSQTLMDEVNEQISAGIRLCAVDISQVRYMNSVGVDVLISLLTRFRNKGGEVIVLNPSGQVQKLLIITKLNAIFQLAGSLEEGLEKLKASV